MSKWEDKIREICTYYSELGEGTAGYSLSEEQFQKLFDSINSLLSQQKKEWIEKVEGTKAVFKDHDGVRICSRHNDWSGNCSCEEIINPFVDDVISILKE